MLRCSEEKGLVQGLSVSPWQPIVTGNIIPVFGDYPPAPRSCLQGNTCPHLTWATTEPWFRSRQQRGTQIRETHALHIVSFNPCAHSAVRCLPLPATEAEDGRGPGTCPRCQVLMQMEFKAWWARCEVLFLGPGS